jgi:hypothetical protein
VLSTTPTDRRASARIELAVDCSCLLLSGAAGALSAAASEELAFPIVAVKRAKLQLLLQHVRVAALILPHLQLVAMSAKIRILFFY